MSRDDELNRESGEVTKTRPRAATDTNISYSDRRAWITSTRAARAAGNIEAITATASIRKAETTTGKAPGIFTSRKNLPARRASTKPKAAPATTPATAITAPS